MRLELPDSKSKESTRNLVEALDVELGASETEMNVARVGFQLVDAYLMGIRKFKVLNRWTGAVAVAWENRKGELDLRYEEVLLHYMVQVGRLLKMDVTPPVGRSNIYSFRFLVDSHRIFGDWDTAHRSEHVDDRRNHLTLAFQLQRQSPDSARPAIVMILVMNQ